jgi:hypothetical protein
MGKSTDREILGTNFTNFHECEGRGLTGGNGENRGDSGNHLMPRLIGASEATKLRGMGTLYYGDNLDILRCYFA